MTGPRFQLRKVLTWITFVAILIGWYTSLMRERTRSDKRIQQLTQQLMNAQSEIRSSNFRTDLRARMHGRLPPELGRLGAIGKSVLADANFEHVNLRGAVIQGGVSAFQQTVFDNSDLSDASLTGGGA